MSSLLNALSSVTWEDLLKKHIEVSDACATYIIKCLSKKRVAAPVLMTNTNTEETYFQDFLEILKRMLLNFQKV